MTPLQGIQFTGRVAITGTVTSMLSLACLLALSKMETGHAAAALNGSSQILHGKKALRQRDACLSYTAPAALIHHAASHWWAAVQEHPAMRRALPNVGGRALLVAAFAAFLDYGLLPRRWSPGYEGQLSRRAIAGVFGAIAAGLALGSWLQDRPMKLTARTKGRILGLRTRPNDR